MRTEITRGCAVLGLSLAALVLAPPAPARACSLDFCAFGYAAPTGGEIPVNAPALAYVASPLSGNNPATNLLLMTLDGQPLPFTWEPDPAGAEQFLIRPATPLQMGAAYRLVGIGSCPVDDPTTAATGFNSAFTVGPPASLPTSFEVTALAPVVTALDVPDDGMCTAHRRVTVAYLNVSGIGVSAYRNLTRFMLEVDGKPWAGSAYGGAARLDNDPLVPYAICNGSGGPLPGLPTGRHHGQLSIHVAGAPSDPPPVAFDFDLDCAAPVVSDVPPAGNGGGCAVGGGQPASSTVTSCLIGLCVLALAARTARTGRRHPRRIPVSVDRRR